MLHKAKRNHLIIIVLLCLLLSLTIGVAWALPLANIDTNDNAVDLDWAVATTTDPEGDAAPHLDIVSGWVAMSTDGSTLYFRAEFLNAGALGSKGQVGAYVDCNGDGIVNASQDRIVSYEYTTDKVRIHDTEGTKTLYESPATTTAGERTSDTSNMEWSIPLATLLTDGQCTEAQHDPDSMAFQFASAELAFPVIGDGGDDFEAPTAIHLQTVDAGETSGMPGGTMVILVSVLATASVAALSFNRRDADMSPR